MDQLEDHSIDLVVTSPPYPMISMWDEIMGNQNPQIKAALARNEGSLVFELMHQELDKVWWEVCRVVKPGGIVCINIGDATRSISGQFALYSNHTRIIQAFLAAGFSNLPNIIWRKQTNAPNKFMGSGMLPAGAYVTLEHEWILVFRKGGKRSFTTNEEKARRKESAYFWEERNIWFSDVWDLKGIKQQLESGGTRERSAAYPFEIPYRLINMYSIKGHTVLDPFLGTGTTSLAAMAAERNSIGYEIDQVFATIMKNSFSPESVLAINLYLASRLASHTTFATNQSSDPQKTALKHFNHTLNLPVMTSQETELQLNFIREIIPLSETLYEASYTSDAASQAFSFEPNTSQKTDPLRQNS